MDQQGENTTTNAREPTAETDVLIVGAGPTGMTLACELLRRGIQCCLIDRLNEPVETSRAFDIQSRTLEVFEAMGMVEKALEVGMHAKEARVYEREKLLITMYPKSVGDVPYPYVLTVPQSRTEHLLLERLHELGGVVERSRELVALRQEGDVVVASIDDARADSTNAQEMRARWVVGCDGSHSTVRKLLDIPFEGSTRDEEFLLADVDLDWEKDRDINHIWLHHDGLFAAMPLPQGRQWRLFADVARVGGAVPRASVELFQALTAERTGESKTVISNPTWLSNFSINQRMVRSYRQGRVFLAGDAAHIHSPIGGQGMNTGIQDAYNLAWKLALVIGGKAAERLLDTYEEERKPVARRILGGTTLGTDLFVSKNPVLRLIRDHVLLHLLSLNIVQRAMAQVVSGLGINYRSSSLSHSYQGTLADKTRLSGRKSEKASLKDWVRFSLAPRSGDRAPQGPCLRSPSRTTTSLFEEFRGTTSTLLLFDGLAQTAEGYTTLSRIARRVEALLGNDIKTHFVVSANDRPDQLDWDGSILLDPEHQLHRRYGAGAASLYFIRPDGYIGFRSQPAREEPLLAYLGRLFLLQG